MSKLITKKEIIPIIIILLVGLVTIAAYPCLSAKIPSHWNLAGEVDRYMNKNFVALFFPALILLIYLLITFLPFIDPLRENIEKSAQAYFWLRTILIGFFALIYFYMIYAGLATGKVFPINFLIIPTLGLMIIAIGFLLPKFKRNYFIGIRTPWTLHSDEVWEKTHQRAKNWFIAAGLVLIIGSLFRQLSVCLILLIIIFLWPVVDSYFIYRKHYKLK